MTLLYPPIFNLLIKGTAAILSRVRLAGLRLTEPKSRIVAWPSLNIACGRRLPLKTGTMAQKWRSGTNQRKTAPKALNIETLQALALHYVGRFATSQARLAAYLDRKLRERGWEGDDPPRIDQVVSRLAELGYVDDKAYAVMKSGAMQRRGLGQRRINQTLRQDGINEDDSLEAAPDAAERWAAAERLARRKRIGPYATEMADRPVREKQLAAFLRAGHDMQMARRWIESAPGEMPEPPEDRD